MGERNKYERKEFIYRVGTFFLLVGIGFLVFFMLSEAAQQPEFNYFCGSMILLSVGFFFRARYRRAITPSGRFSRAKRFFRRIFGRGGGSDDEDEEYDEE
ncbi:MAG TPA: hypothetical protein VK851_15265 [Anaerolineales bacterium]|nr:hypothetical protein [Anaerolineales bacterium]